MSEPVVKVANCSSATTRPFPSQYGDIVVIFVGALPNKKRYNIHAGLLKQYSSYFRNGLEGGWNEGNTRSFTLEDEDPDIFQLFYHWIYSSQLYTTTAEDDKIPVSFEQLCSVFVLGDARGIPELCNAAIDSIFEKFAKEWTYPIACLPLVFENTLDGSNLRKLWVDFGVGTFLFNDIKKFEHCYPKDFLMDVISRSVEKKTWPGNLTSKQGYLQKKAAEICSEYHDHKDPHVV